MKDLSKIEIVLEKDIEVNGIIIPRGANAKFDIPIHVPDYVLIAL